MSSSVAVTEGTVAQSSEAVNQQRPGSIAPRIQHEFEAKEFTVQLKKNKLQRRQGTGK
jgi:hypothetical protein